MELKRMTYRNTISALSSFNRIKWNWNDWISRNRLRRVQAFNRIKWNWNRSSACTTSPWWVLLIASNGIETIDNTQTDTRGAPFNRIKWNWNGMRSLNLPNFSSSFNRIKWNWNFTRPRRKKSRKLLLIASNGIETDIAETVLKEEKDF